MTLGERTASRDPDTCWFTYRLPLDGRRTPKIKKNDGKSSNISCLMLNRGDRTLVAGAFEVEDPETPQQA